MEENSKLTRITVRDVPQSVIDKLDKITEEKGYSSRNMLVVEILSKYAECQDALFYQSLPPIVKEICKEVLLDHKKDVSGSVEIAANNISLAALQLLNIAQWFERYIMIDTPSQSDKELSSLIEKMEKDNSE